MKIGIVGFGRIGRALYRINRARRAFDVVAVNDINPDPDNVAYQLKYDSEYGRIEDEVRADGDTIRVGDDSFRLFCERNIEDVPWAELGVELVIDASGVHRNVLAAPEVVAQGVPRVLVTHSPKEVDKTIILGVNEHEYDPAAHAVVSSSICDAVAVSPVLKVLEEAIGIESGHLTTLHPWLSYQNLLDGPAMSWAYPDQVYHQYPLGRASTNALIPKPTSAVSAVSKVLPDIAERLRCMSFRVPTPVVGAANLTVNLARDSSIDEVRDAFRTVIANQKWPILRLEDEPLVSVDYLARELSAVVDDRWTELAGGRHLYLVLWYDNEWGYASHALRVAEFIAGR